MYIKDERFNQYFGLEKSNNRFLLLNLFETSEGQTYFALIHLESTSFFVELAMLESKYREVENFFGRALVDLCDLIFNKETRESISKISEFNYKFVCFVVENIPKLTIIILNNQLQQKHNVINLIDLRVQENTLLLRMKDRI